MGKTRKPRKSKLHVVEKTRFINALCPITNDLDGKLGYACQEAAKNILKKLRDVKRVSNYNSKFSVTCEDIIYRTFQAPSKEGINQEHAEFTVETLNAMLCWFFVKKHSDDEFYEKHTIEDLEKFFALIVQKTNRKESELKKINNFFSDIDLIKDQIASPFNLYDYEINENWEFSIVKNITEEENSENKKIGEVPLHIVENPKKNHWLIRFLMPDIVIIILFIIGWVISDKLSQNFEGSYFDEDPLNNGLGFTYLEPTLNRSFQLDSLETNIPNYGNFQSFNISMRIKNISDLSLANVRARLEFPQSGKDSIAKIKGSIYNAVSGSIEDEVVLYNLPDNWTIDLWFADVYTPYYNSCFNQNTVIKRPLNIYNFIDNGAWLGYLHGKNFVNEDGELCYEIVVTAHFDLKHEYKKKTERVKFAKYPTKDKKSFFHFENDTLKPQKRLVTQIDKKGESQTIKTILHFKNDSRSVIRNARAKLNFSENGNSESTHITGVLGSKRLGFSDRKLLFLDNLPSSWSLCLQDVELTEHSTDCDSRIDLMDQEKVIKTITKEGLIIGRLKGMSSRTSSIKDDCNEGKFICTFTLTNTGE